ncbi:MAG: DUF2256 and DUF3253 domain-containing protein [Phycisphaerales bacterium]|nr:DUF2256 and DUF3253 domain-containing protein [Phycisphaerales bacterium]
MSTPDPKICVSCGRSIEWRRKWARDWDEVRYCSQACRRSKVSDADRAIEEVILSLLHDRSSGSSICPSDAAQRLDPDDWRARLPDVRRAARRLVASGRLEITQGGQVVDPSKAKGPIRLRQPRRSS